MIYNGKFKVTSPFGSRNLNGKIDNHKGIKTIEDVPYTILPEVKIALAELGWEEAE